MPEAISIGQLIDLLVRDQHQQHQKEGKPGLTEYTQNLAQSCNLSKRQIDRLRQDADFPKGEAVVKLAKALPDLEVLNPGTICQRLLLPFENIEREQQQLSDKASSIQGKNKITIAAGWKRPQGLENELVAISIANNIQKGFNYEFVFPDLKNYPSSDRDKPEPELQEEANEELKKWLLELILKVKVIWDRQESQRLIEKIKSQQYPDLGSDSAKQTIVDKLIKNIKFVSTENQSVTQFWLLIPSLYVVLYNLNEKDSDPDWKYGSFFVDGLLFRGKAKELTNLESQGWLHLTEDQYQDIEKEYARHRNKWKEINLDESAIKLISR